MVSRVLPLIAEEATGHWFQVLDQIVVTATGTYFNIAAARTKGFEFYLQAKPCKGLTVRAAYTYLTELKVLDDGGLVNLNIITGTDNILVVAGQGKVLDYAGGHAKMGELINRAVYQGVREAVAQQNGITSGRCLWPRLAERRWGLYEMVRSLPGASRKQILSLWETALLRPRYAGFMETALVLSLK